jgi:beta-phosphoglucomutase family hydrolase
MSLKGVIFDWDGVVINSSTLHRESWEILAKELRLSIPKDHFEQGFGKRNEMIIPEILKWSGTKEQIQQWGRRKEIIYRRLAKKNGIPILKGIKELLKSLKQAMIPCAIGTSTERKNIRLAFELLNLDSYFQGIVCSEDVKNGKPDPEVFIKAARTISVAPMDCVVLEDSTHGIEAAKKGEMKALGVCTSKSEEDLFNCGADHVVNCPASINIPLLNSLFVN